MSLVCFAFSRDALDDDDGEDEGWSVDAAADVFVDGRNSFVMVSINQNEKEADVVFKRKRYL